MNDPPAGEGFAVSRNGNLTLACTQPLRVCASGVEWELLNGVSEEWDPAVCACTQDFPVPLRTPHPCPSGLQAVELYPSLIPQRWWNAGIQTGDGEALPQIFPQILETS